MSLRPKADKSASRMYVLTVRFGLAVVVDVNDVDAEPVLGLLPSLKANPFDTFVVLLTVEAVADMVADIEAETVAETDEDTALTEAETDDKEVVAVAAATAEAATEAETVAETVADAVADASALSRSVASKNVRSRLVVEKKLDFLFTSSSLTPLTVLLRLVREATAVGESAAIDD